MRFSTYCSVALALSLLLLATPLAAQDVSVSAALESNDRQAEAGDRVTVDYVVRNRSNVEIEDIRVGFYLSTDRTFSSDDTFLEEEEVDVDENESEDDSEQVSLPTSVADGDYFFLTVLDPDNQISETNEANNTDASPITIGEGGTSTGGTGGGDTDDDDGEDEDEDEDDGEDDDDGEDEGEDEDEDEDENDDEDDDDGEDEDENDDEGEGDETEMEDDDGEDSDGDDATRANLLVAAAQRTMDDAEVEAGDRVTVEYTLRNDGVDAAEDFAVAFYLSTDGALSSRDILLEEQESDDLEAGEQVDQTQEVKIPQSSQPGTYFVIIQVDSNRSVRESNERDNTASTSSVVVEDIPREEQTGRPDLTLPSLGFSDTSESTLEPGGRTEVEYVLRNSGMENATRFNVGFYLSTDNALSGDDVFIEFDRVRLAREGKDRSENETLIIPQDTEPGMYQIIAAVDVSGQINETEENNNLAFATIVVTGMVTSSEAANRLALSLDAAPNPFASTATLRYSVPQAGPVRLEAFDLLGRRVALLVDGPRQAGPHSVRFDAARLPSGVYLVRLMAGEQQTMRRLTLVR